MTSANPGDRPEQQSSALPLAERIAALMAAPDRPERPFGGSGATYRSIYRKAQEFTTTLQALPNQEQPILLCTANRALTAAVLLAAAGQTPPLVIPYALTQPALKEIQDTMPIQGIITDHPRNLPAGTPLITTRPARDRTGHLEPGPIDRTMVYLFTGGSTGRPQIWPKTARNLLGEAFLLRDHFQIDVQDRLLATVVPYHIYGLLFSVLVPLTASAGLIEGIPTYPQEIIGHLQTGRATTLVSVPLHYRTLNGLDFTAPHLKRAISSAGRLEPGDGAAFHRQTGVGVTEIYGSTETGGIAMRNRALDETDLTPLPGVAWEIRAERLHVRSPFLSPGLKTDPQGYFRTGDRAAASDGEGFVLQGRADGIVKVGGKRVDLEAVAEALKRLPGVRDAVVIPRPGRKGRETDILGVAESAADPAELRRQLSRSVEAYALPRRILAVKRMPVSSTGKYDRAKIEQMFNSRRPEKTGVGK
jgi:acyl-coenzyme A synthetase/AMP-(fatty) acid ligase